MVPIKNQEADLLLTEELQNHMPHLPYMSPYAIALRKDTRNFIREVVDLTDNRIKQRLLHQLVNEPTPQEYDASLTEIYLGKSQKILRIAERLQRKSKSRETIDLIEQCKLSVRQCYHALELIIRTDKALESQDVHLPEGLEYLKNDL